MTEAQKILEAMIASFGIQKDVDFMDYVDMQVAFDNGQYVDCVHMVRRIFRLLKVDIRVKYVENHPVVRGVSIKNLTPIQRLEMRNKITRIAPEIYEDKKFYPARVHLSDSVPMYNSTRVEICMEISKVIIFEPADIFIIAVAHEIAHILMYMLKHPYKRSEKATEIAVMLNGFMSIYEKIYSVHRARGYLSEREYMAIKRFIKERKGR